MSKVIATVLTYRMRAKSMLQAPKAKAAAAAASTNATMAKDSGISTKAATRARHIERSARVVVEHEGIGGLYRELLGADLHGHHEDNAA